MTVALPARRAGRTARENIARELRRRREQENLREEKEGEAGARILKAALLGEETGGKVRS